MKKYKIILLTLMILTIFACAPKKEIPLSPEDNPEHHYLMGMKLIDQDKLTEAKIHFQRALALDPDYSRSYAGLGLVSAINAEKEKDSKHKKAETERAADYLKKANKKAKNNTELFSIYVSAIRIYLHAKPKGWLSKAEEYYQKAKNLEDVKEKELIYYRQRSAADYFMGKAYFKAFKFRKAEDTLSKVLSAPPGQWHEPADALYRKVQKIVRAQVQYTLTKIAKRIAVKDKINRADVAALLVDELHLNRFFSGHLGTNKAPGADFIPADIQNNLFRDEILTVIKWHVRGLEPIYDQTTRAYLFKPNKPLTRKELALILEDLLIKITGDESIATRYFGEESSPYPDVRPTDAWFNATMNAVTRGLMETDLSGKFRPNDYVDGAELLLAVLRLRNVLSY